MAIAKDSKNVLVVTNYFGFLHIVPLSNLTFYQSHNFNNPEKQYSWKEMSEEEAAKYVDDNNGYDPKFKTPKQQQQALADKDAELEKLKADRANQDAELQKLRDLLNKASNQPTIPNASTAVTTTGSQSSAPPAETKETADEVIIKIKVATTPEEVKKLSEGDDRKTVKDAATKKLAELNAQ